jgi:methylmalonyl-CoA decarboxylase
MSLIQTQFAGGIGTIVLNNDSRRNVLGEALVSEIWEVLSAFETAGARAVVLRANPGIKVWSAGHDVEELPEKGGDPLKWSDPLRKLVRHIEACQAPVIAQVDGSVWGGACEVVFACDLIVATPTASFAATPARLGVPYNATGLLTYLNSLPLRIAKEMLFTARPLTAERLERLGIINHVVDAGEIDEFCRALTADIANNAPLSISVMKEQMRILSAARAMSPYDFERIQGLRHVVLSSDDYEEGIEAFKSKRKPKFSGN